MMIWLVVTGTMEFYDFPETVGNVIIPTDGLHHFSELWKSDPVQARSVCQKTWRISKSPDG